jgi:hypothetical protein
MRRSAIGTTRQLTMHIDGAQGTCCNRRLQSWSGLDVDLPSLTAYDANRTPSSVPTGNRALIFGPHFRLGIVDILVLTVFSNPIMRKPYRILNDLITSILRRNTNDDNRSERRLCRTKVRRG